MLPEPRRNGVHDIVGVAVEQYDYYNCQYTQLRRENVGQATARVALHGHPYSPARNAIAGNNTASIIVSGPKSSLIMLLRERTRPGLGIIEPCLPSPAKVPPSGPGWLHEIKHDGFRILARRNGAGVQLITRAGNDFSSRFPLIAIAVGGLPVHSCLIDGEAIVCNERGLAVFDLIRRHGTIASAAHCAFDLLELDDRDLRREPIEERKRLLAKLLRGSHLSIVLNEHFEEDGAIVYREACKLGCEGIVSKRLGSLYRSGRSRHWIKVKNPEAPAVRRESEEDWGR